MPEITIDVAVSTIKSIITSALEIARREPSFAATMRQVAANLATSLTNTAAYRDPDRALGDLARSLNRNAGYLTLTVIADGRREEAEDTHAPRTGLRDLYDSMVNLAATILHVELPEQRPLAMAAGNRR
jgi:hypothetical protein